MNIKDILMARALAGGGGVLLGEFELNNVNCTVSSDIRVDFNDDVQTKMNEIFSKIHDNNRSVFGVFTLLGIKQIMPLAYNGASEVPGLGAPASLQCVTVATCGNVYTSVFFPDCMETNLTSTIQAIGGGYSLTVEVYMN